MLLRLRFRSARGGTVGGAGDSGKIEKDTINHLQLSGGLGD